MKRKTHRKIRHLKQTCRHYRNAEQHFDTSISHCRCLNLVTMIRLRNTVQNYFNFLFGSGSSKRIRLRNNVGNYVQVILLLSDLFCILSKGIRTKIVWTKVSFRYFSNSELFRSEIRAFGDSSLGNTVGGLEIETSHKYMPSLKKIFIFAFSFYIIWLMTNMFSSYCIPLAS
jgi:hypothetical protein